MKILYYYVQKEQLPVDNQQKSEESPVISSDVPPVPAENTDAASDLETAEADSDTTFAEYAAKLGITEEELRKANGNTTEVQIKKGDLIFVPKKKN